jgi:hypothetical protein
LLDRCSIVEPLCQPFFLLGVFEIGSCFIFPCTAGWPWTVILKLSASRVARIIGYVTSAWFGETILIQYHCQS